MNAEAEYRYIEQKAQTLELGQEQYRLQALQQLKLKTVIKVCERPIYACRPFSNQ